MTDRLAAIFLELCLAPVIYAGLSMVIVPGKALEILGWVAQEARRLDSIVLGMAWDIPVSPTPGATRRKQINVRLAGLGLASIAIFRLISQ